MEDIVLVDEVTTFHEAAELNVDQEGCSGCTSKDDTIKELHSQLVEARETITQLWSKLGNAECQGAINTAAEIKELKKALSDSKCFAKGLEQLAIQENRAKRAAERKSFESEHMVMKTGAEHARTLIRVGEAEAALAQAKLDLRESRSTLKALLDYGIYTRHSSRFEENSTSDPFWFEMWSLKEATNPIETSSVKLFNFNSNDKPYFRSSSDGASTTFTSVSSTKVFFSSIEKSAEKYLFSPAAVLRACREALIGEPWNVRAALSKHWKRIDLTMKRTLEIVGSYDDECDPVHECVSRGDVVTGQFLIAAGANLHTASADGETIFGIAKDGACRNLLEHHFAVLAALEDEPTALVSSAVAYCAAFSANDELMPMTTVDLRSYQLDPSFFWAPRAARSAIFSRAVDVYKALVAATVQPFPVLPDDCCGDILEFLMGTMPRKEALCIGQQCSSIEAQAWVRAVIAAAIAVHATTQLVPAARSGDFFTVQDCLAKGANVDEKSADERIALTEAATHGHTDIVEFLLKAGADIEAVSESYDGFTALGRASSKGYADIVELLVEAGANVDARGRFDEIALMLASIKGYADIVLLLLQAGAILNVYDELGSSPIQFASSYGHADVVKLFLEAGAEVERSSYMYESPLLEASVKGHIAVVEVLLEAGANIDETNENGQTASDLAEEQGHPAVVALLQRP